MIQHSQTCQPGFQTRSGLRYKIPVLRNLFVLHDIWKERRLLSVMDAHRLDDMGLSLTDAKEEARRAAWDAPERWRR
jgi:uncharacterized protein YjiS (DUF1127 family)